jgi:hypothetical protein
MGGNKWNWLARRVVGNQSLKDKGVYLAILNNTLYNGIKFPIPA